MIIGIGSDIANIDRISASIAKFGSRFINRILSPLEQSSLKPGMQPASREFACTLGKRFAAKEACSKALGTGFQYGISWQEIQIRHLPSGQPCIELSGKALEQAQKLSGSKEFKLHLTMSDDYPWAQAFVVMETV